MTTKRIARILRRIANLLDPVRVEPVTPLEFIGSRELANTIRDRNDLCILFWGKESRDGEKWSVDGESAWRIKTGLIEPVMLKILDDIAQANP